MADGKVEKIIEFKAAEAINQIDKLIGRLNRVNQMVSQVEKTAGSISFEKFIPAIDNFAKSFSKLRIDPQNLDNISKMAQALNRFKMTSVELNKSNFDISFAKITKGIYSFTDSISRMKLLGSTITQISELGRAINRLTNSSIKLQNTKVSFTSLTQAIYAFVGSILRLKELDAAIAKLNSLADVLDRLKIYDKKTFFRGIVSGATGVARESNKAAKNVKNQADQTNALSKAQDTLNNALNRTNNQLNRIAKYISINNLMRIYNWLERIGETLYDLVKVYSEYQENINLATVAYGGLENAAKSLYPFVERISTAFGLNESEVIRAIGLFKQMGNAMQLAQEDSELLSSGLTKMAYDISSLYNISFDRALSALQSALVGQTKPIRSATGADITENTLRMTLKNLGITKEIRDLSYVEKRLVMVISLTKQLTNAQGDLARTIESPANQLKILQQQLERLRIALGDLINVFVGRILPYINGFVMALVEVIKYVTEFVKQLLGIEDMEYDYSGLTGTSDSVDDLIDGLEEANETAEELKKNLVGIDELNILEPKEESSSFEIDPTILAAFKAALTDWDNKMDEVEMKAYKIRDAILSWFGMKPGENGEWELIPEGKLDRFLSKLERLVKAKNDFFEQNPDANWLDFLNAQIGDTIRLILNLGETWLNLKFPLPSAIIGFMDAVKDFQNGNYLHGILETIESIGLVLFWIGTIVGNSTFTGLGLTIYGISRFIQDLNKYLEDGELSLKEIIGLVADLLVSGIGILLLTMSGNLSSIVGSLSSAVTWFKDLGAAIVGAIGGNSAASSALTFMLDSVSKIAGAILIAVGAIETIWGVFEWLKDGEPTLDSVYKILQGISLVILGIGVLIGNVPLIIAGAVGIIISWLMKWDGENGALYNSIKNVFQTVVDSIKKIIEALKPAVKAIIDLLGKILPVIVDILSMAIDLIVPVVDFVVALIEGAVNILASIIEGLANFIGGVVESISQILGGIIDFIVGIFTLDLERAFKGIKNIFVGLVNAVITIIEAAINVVVAVLNTIIGLILGAVKGLVNLIGGTIEKIGSWLGFDWNLTIKGEIPKIPTAHLTRVQAYENGGYPNKGMFLMNEGTSAEMLGSIGGKTAVVNNEEIASALAQAMSPLLGSVVTAVQNVAATDRPIVLNIDSREAARATQKGNRKLGYNQIGGEFANV